VQVVYAQQAPPSSLKKSIFLAGPTPRGPEAQSWRPNAIQLLRARGFDGVVFVPEDQSGGMSGSYQDQIEWEETCLHLADCVVFWVPRDLKTMPAYTTNIEWGVWGDSRKAVLGAPPSAPKLRYLRHYADKLHVPQRDTLEETLTLALDRLGEGALRVGGEREVPLHLWRQASFQTWYQALRAAGNRLDGARVRWQYAQRDSLFCWALQVNVFIAAEQRNKRSEVIVTRPDISAVLAYYPGATREETRVLLVKEFRSAGATSDGFVHELPSGSSHQEGLDPRQVAAEELEEEAGLKISPERLVYRLSRQSAATLLTHRVHLYSVALTQEELASLSANEGKRFGAINTERTYIELRSLHQIRTSTDLDWSHLGMILSVL
jgi:8-oxo-dGTP pyrophosphatase MutT (NUDIX family)